ncbi:hypothetical protein ACR6C2_44955 [Streptomyces sp. INA 01156]
MIGEPVNIIGHPMGRLKEIAVRDNALQVRLDDFLHYRTDTEPGNSGSPFSTTSGRSSPSTTAVCPGPMNRAASCAATAGSGSPATATTPSTGCPTRGCVSVPS